MAGITLTEAETHLSTWLDADKAVAKGQSFSISGKTYTRADASVIRENIEFWDRQVKRLSRGVSRGGIKIFGGTPTQMLKLDEFKVKENVIDRIVRFLDPVKAKRRFRARPMMTLSGSYIGAPRPGLEPVEDELGRHGQHPPLQLHEAVMESRHKSNILKRQVLLCAGLFSRIAASILTATVINCNNVGAL